MRSRRNVNKRLAFILPGTKASSACRFRVLQYLNYLEKEGFNCELYFPCTYKMKGELSVERKFGDIHILLTNLMKLFVFLLIKKYDRIFIQRYIIHPKIPVEIIFGLFFKSRIILDFDDAVFLHCPKRYSLIIKSAGRIIVGNRYLYEFAKKHHKNIWIIPTPVETGRYYPINGRNRANTEFTIGWMGSPSGLGYLTSIYGALQQLTPKINFKLIVVSDFNRHEEIHVPGVKVINKQWSRSEELTCLISFDIGLMPLGEDSFSLGKCSYKALQYMAVGIPAVVSAIGNNKEIIDDGIDGFLYSNSDEFVDKTLRLAKDDKLRVVVGNRAVEKIRKKFATCVVVKDFIRVLS